MIQSKAVQPTKRAATTSNASTGQTLLSCVELRKSFHSGSGEVEVIRGIDLSIRRGEFTVVMGGSGSGKSTLLYLLAGLERANHGDIRFDGRSYDNLGEAGLSKLRRSGMGFIFQAFNLVPNLTLLENALVAGYLNATPRSQIEARAATLFESLGLTELLDRLPAQVSGGEQQRAAIVRALMNAPDIVFADEPTGALNSTNGIKVLDCFSSLWAQGQSLFMVTHDLKAACRGSRVLYMRDGVLHGEFRFSDEPSCTAERERDLFNWLSVRGW
jgi:putative ABC transport system ATP-binding protein